MVVCWELGKKRAKMGRGELEICMPQLDVIIIIIICLFTNNRIMKKATIMNDN